MAGVSFVRYVRAYQSTALHYWKLTSDASGVGTHWNGDNIMNNIIKEEDGTHKE